MNATVRDVMNARVIALKRTADFKEIISVMRQHRVSACPVVNDAGQVIGLVSEADLLFKEADPGTPCGSIRLRWKLSEESKVNAVTAGHLMTSPAVTIHPDAAVAVAARVMQDRRLKRLPVVTDDGTLIGIVSRADVLSVYERPDADILDEVRTVIMAGEFGLNPASFTVTVTSGIVTITGMLGDPDTALELVARVRHAEGVVAVRDRLTIGENGSDAMPSGRSAQAAAASW
ncbi:MAG TPA: CBS domain-containing protein [Streptosporangiaceae bacterium]|nr:CBS domain-containing protein [Streptosporangiaceae bacterium]